jgi:hypothetical protein
MTVDHVVPGTADRPFARHGERQWPDDRGSACVMADLQASKREHRLGKPLR